MPARHLSHSPQTTLGKPMTDRRFGGSRHDGCFAAGRGQIMLDVLKNMLFGCAHRRTTFPLTPYRRLGPRIVRPAGDGMYVACLDCGKEFHYDWNEMRRGEPMLARRRPALDQPQDADLCPVASSPNFD